MDTNRVLVFFDVEATGTDAEDRLCQVAYRATNNGTEVHAYYFKPPVPIKIGAMEVHHITEAAIADKPVFIDSPLFHDLKDRFEHQEHIFVAHNAKYDAGMLAKEGITVTAQIDTLKIAKHLYPNMEWYRLQFLRYALGIEVDAIAHDARGDVMVLERLFYTMLQKLMDDHNISQDSAIEKMIEWTKEPMLIKYFNFGKHKNKSVEEVAQEDPGYLQWLLGEKEKNDGSASNDDEDWLYTLRYYLKK